MKTASPNKVPSTTAWYYWTGTKRKGPYTAEQIHALLRTSTVTPDTLVAAGGDTSWQPLSQVEALHHWSSPVLQAFAEGTSSSNPSKKNSSVECVDCKRIFDRSLTLPVGIQGKRICKLCHNNPKAQSSLRNASSYRKRRNTAIALLACFLVAGAAILWSMPVLLPSVTLPLPPWSDVRWVRESPDNWPSLLCHTEILTPANERVFHGAAFLLNDSGGKNPILVTASRNLLSHAPANTAPTTSDAQDPIAAALERISFRPYPTKKMPVGTRVTPHNATQSMIDGDLLMLRMNESPSVTGLRLRKMLVRSGTPATLIAPPSEPNGPHRAYKGTVITGGDSRQHGLIAMDDIFPAEWLIGSPIVDSNARVIGMLSGEHPVDFSEVGNRNTLRFIPASQLTQLARQSPNHPAR